MELAVMPPQWPGASMVRDELDQVPRREAFKREHPGAKFGPVGNVYVGHVPYMVDGEERSITIGADSWVGLLDALETYFADDPDTG